MAQEWKSNALGLLGIALGLLAFINEENRLWAGVILAAAIVFYIINSFSNDIEEYDEKVKKLGEKLAIHEQLVALKADVEYLKREVHKK